MSAQGELPHLPGLGKSFAMVELRSADGAVLSVDYSSQPASVSIGQSVLLDDLKLTGLREESVKDEKGREFSCPNCGAPVTAALASSKSITCGSCHSIIDLSQGVGAELKHAIQDEPVVPLIALGSQGSLQGAPWQVVGFQHRMGTDPSDPDEQFGWEEYLLYNQKRGFIFLVDSSEGWSVVKPTTGAPTLSDNGRSASYLGTSYQLKESYSAETSYVLGEFYWQVTRGQQTQNRDFVSGPALLSMEQSANEVTWSLGSKIESDAVAKAFKLEDKKELLKRSDAGPGSAGKKVGCGTIIVVVIIILVLLLLVGRCSGCDPKVENCSGSSSRSSGGSYGGSSSGGGHK
jgi:ribosomal protein S27AE